MNVKVFVIMALFLGVVAAGCAGTPATPIPTPTLVVGPVVVVIPFGPSVSVVSTDVDAWYSLGRVSLEDATGVTLPSGYRVPQRVEIRGTHGVVNGKIFLVLFGQGELPVNPERIIRTPLTEEIRVGPLREGLTQVLFEEVSSSK